MTAQVLVSAHTSHDRANTAREDWLDAHKDHVTAFRLAREDLHYADFTAIITRRTDGAWLLTIQAYLRAIR